MPFVLLTHLANIFVGGRHEEPYIIGSLLQINCLKCVSFAGFEREVVGGKEREK